MIKIIVISDIRIYREGLSHVLANTDSIGVVGAADNIDDAILTIERDSPDVILLDMTMANSCCVARKVMGICPNAKVVALSVPENEDNIVECAEAGIVGYVARESSLNDLIDAVVGTKKGEFYCPPKIAACIFKKIKDLAQDTKKQVFATGR